MKNLPCTIRQELKVRLYDEVKNSINADLSVVVEEASSDFDLHGKDDVQFFFKGKFLGVISTKELKALADSLLSTSSQMENKEGIA